MRFTDEQELEAVALYQGGAYTFWLGEFPSS